MKVSVMFYKGARGGLFDWLICAFTASRYSHCELRLGTTTVNADTRRGVVTYLDKQYPASHWDEVTVGVGEDGLRAIFIFANQVLDARYDWSGIVFSELFPFKRHASSRWYCSELCCAALRLGGVLPFSQRKTVSPGRLHRLLRRLTPSP